MHVGSTGRVALQTAQAVLKGGEKSARVRVLFDAGSHRSFVTSKVARSAGLNVKRQEWIEISTFGGQSRESGLRKVCEIDVFPMKGGEGVPIEAYEVPSITQIRNEHLEVRKTEYPHLHGLWFSDVCRGKEVLEVDLLIGADYLWSFQNGRTIRGESDEPVAVETCLGWVLSGPMKGSSENGMVSVNLVGHGKARDASETEDFVHKLWDYETLGIREGDEVHEALKDAISFNGERYQVRLPWKEGHGVLPSNYGNSLKRLKGQMQKLKRDPEILTEYDSIIKEQTKSGIVERVTELENVGKVHYLPHHAVVRQNAKTTKVRVVYDASSRDGRKGVSLNDCLHVGPALSPLLYDILIRFREKRIALCGDIEKAFLNIEVERQDRDCLRFLWVEDVREEVVNPVVYRFCRVVFGVNCSPFLLNATLQYHLDSFSELDPEFVRVLKKSFYVDDLVSGDATVEGTIELHGKAKARLAEGGFRLRKWLTNSAEVMNAIQASEQKEAGTVCDENSSETYAKEMLGTKGEARNEKVVGLEWNCEEDTFHFELSGHGEKATGLVATKRNLLKVLAGLYDPLGIISPILVGMKVLFQELCMNKVGWGDELTDEWKGRWMRWVEDLKLVRVITVPRCLYPMAHGEVTCSLHGFADASKKAYCAMIYFVCKVFGSVHVELLTSKTRVALLKAQTIPRLELMSGRVLAQLMDTVRNALKDEVEISATRLWLDSKIALCWINNQGEWKQFVRQRVNEILKLTRKEDWAHCPGSENPADVGSRGELASTLKGNELWWKGPQWLSGPVEGWPTTEITETPETSDERKHVAVTVASVSTRKGLSCIIDIKRFSKVGKLHRVTAWVRRFLHNLKSRRNGQPRRVSGLNREEIIQAEQEWIREAQEDLKKTENYKELVTTFGLVEQQGVLRCTGRLKNSDLEVEAQQPIILPKEHKLTKLMIEWCHSRVHHGGVRSTLGELRSRFWVPKGRQVVKKVISECVTCKREQGKPYQAPPAAALPEFRVKQAPPFSKVGVDFAGPLYVKSETGKMAKAYIALFTCCVTRAIHLELVTDLAAATFVRCLRRFAARRGTPTLIVSDNAKTFKASEKVLRKLYDHPEVRAYLENERIEWRYNLERAPWWGGFFERLVGSVKRGLRKVLKNAKLTSDELVTTLIELEGTLNSRPLTYEYDELGAEMLTPAHLIYGRRLSTLPDELRNDDEENELGMLKRFRHLARLRIHFWNRWRREYLADLREHHRSTGKKGAVKEVEIGDVVLVHGEHMKRGSWQMGKVVELIVGRDKEVRGAKVKLLTRGKPVQVSRPVQKLYPLEHSIHTVEEEAREEHDSIPVVARQIPRRAAALDSGWRTRYMLDC